MTFSSEHPYIQSKTDIKIYNILKSHRNVWMSAVEISKNLPNNALKTPRMVGGMMRYISEYPGVETSHKNGEHRKVYRYVEVTA